jgi:hypothetical protein
MMLFMLSAKYYTQSENSTHNKYNCDNYNRSYDYYDNSLFYAHFFLRPRYRRTKYPMAIIIIVGMTITRICCVLISSVAY